MTDPYKWRRRPLEEGMTVAAAWRVAVIRKLKQPLDDALYAPFDTLCNDYLSTIRDCDDEFEVRKQVVCILFVGFFLNPFPSGWRLDLIWFLTFAATS